MYSNNNARKSLNHLLFISYSLFTAITLLIALLLPVQSYLPLMKWGHDLPIMILGSKFI